MSDASKNWFETDRKGLAKLIERRGKIALVHELVANALDADGTTRVEIVLEPEEGVPLATVVVRDDAPDGFADISHSWTLFAESSRKGYATKRGRFNFGEKLVLALCTEASIISTKAAVMFDHRGRTNMKARRDRGTEFMGIMRITRAELAEIKIGLRQLISPAGVTITVNGELLPARFPVKTVEAVLATELADEEGNLRRSARKATVHIYEPLPGKVGTLFEMGIPVVETGDRWDVSVEQKIPLNMDRDNVTPAYLRDIRTLVVNAMRDHLTERDAPSIMLREALADPAVEPETVKKALDVMFTKKRAIRDQSDPEANMNVVADGYTLISGGSLTPEQWENVKKHDAANTPPAGKIMPTKKALFHPDGVDRWIPEDKWTVAIRVVVEYTRDVARRLTDRHVRVSVLSDITESYAACYGDQGFVFNLGRLGHEFFEECLAGEPLRLRPTVRLNQLIIHELGHETAANHLSAEYHEALCRLGAKLTELALEDATLFTRLAAP